MSNPYILFVDDDDANRLVFEAVCGDEFRVATAPSAQDALDFLAQHEVGVLISDQRMPGMTGVELLEIARREHPQVARLLITAFSDLESAIDAINRGHIRRYLRKPWDPDLLKRELHDALELYELSDKVQRLERRLVDTERVYSLGIIAASIAHELRNPLAFIKENLERARSLTARSLETLAAEGDGDGAGRRALQKVLTQTGSALDDIEAGVQRMAAVVQGVEVSSRSADANDVDLRDVLRLTLRMVQGQIRYAGRLELAPRASPWVRGTTRDKVGQVLLNLAVNALQAVEANPYGEGIVRIEVDHDEDWAIVEVSDNGPGVAAGDRAKIFDPFFTRKQGEGTGLGLAISKRIAEEAGGTLTVEPSPLGGAMFRLRLPLAKR